MQGLNDISVAEQWDVACTLYANRDLIAAARLAGLPPTIYRREQANRIAALQQAGGVLESDWTLCTLFRSVLDQVLEGRSFEHANINDCQCAAARWRDWHRGSVSRWYSLIYSSR